MGGGVKNLGNSENIGFEVVENYNTKEIISRQILDSPPAKQDASELISRITALCGYTFSTLIYFLL